MKVLAVAALAVKYLTRRFIMEYDPNLGMYTELSYRWFPFLYYYGIYTVRNYLTLYTVHTSSSTGFNFLL